jgi:hypothetical protein
MNMAARPATGQTGQTGVAVGLDLHYTRSNSEQTRDVDLYIA